MYPDVVASDNTQMKKVCHHSTVKDDSSKYEHITIENGISKYKIRDEEYDDALIKAIDHCWEELAAI